MTIQAYGIRWYATDVEWDARGALHRMLGRQHARVPHLRVADFWDQRGIYVLYRSDRPYYVGSAIRQPLGARLKQHRSDSHKGRWNRFSWFGYRKVVGGTGFSELGRATLARSIAETRTIHEMEAVLIHAMGIRHEHSNPGIALHNKHKDPAAIGGPQWLQVPLEKYDYYLAHLTPGRARR